MINYNISNIGRANLYNPKNGHQRIIADRDNIPASPSFLNGSLRYDSKCREYTNKECRR
jgi:hypothetical protein